ncbi:hypothetical protein HMPREF3159_02780 [Brachybacterium sp. HMSC06H03]|nr:hypothetical protein HMPREF3159_02780 [Brachybacterium sp. HMSC06H03]
MRLLAGITGAVVQLALVMVLLGGWAGPVLLASLAFLDRLRETALGSASNAMLKQIVPVTQLPRAVSVNQGREAAVEMASGPVGGALLGLSIVFPPLVHLLGYVGSVLATLSMRGRYRPRAEGSPPTKAVDDLREAFAWIRTQPIRLQMLAVSSAVNLGANGLLFTVMLDLADQGVPASRLGLLNTALAASILLGAFLAPRLVDTVPTGALAIAPVALMALVGVLLPVAPSTVWIGLCYTAIGIGLPAFNASGQGFFTHITPVAMQGRISSLMRLVSLGVMTFAPALAGWGLEIAGSTTTLLLFAAVLALGVVIGLLARDLRRLPPVPLGASRPGEGLLRAGVRGGGLLADSGPQHLIRVRLVSVDRVGQIRTGLVAVADPGLLQDLRYCPVHLLHLRFCQTDRGREQVPRPLLGERVPALGTCELRGPCRPHPV